MWEARWIVIGSSSMALRRPVLGQTAFGGGSGGGGGGGCGLSWVIFF